MTILIQEKNNILEESDEFVYITLSASLVGNNNTNEKLTKLSHFINTLNINGVTWEHLSIVRCNKNPYNKTLNIKSIIDEKKISISQLITFLSIKSINIDVLSLKTYT